VNDSNEVIVKCKGLTKIYGEITALSDLNLEICRGHIFGYIGHNGAGKTTTIRILAGLLRASSGEASIAGQDVGRSLDAIKSLVGYMPDSFGVYEQMRVWEYLDFFGAAFRMPRKSRATRIDHVLDITGAEYMRDRFVDTLSHGMKQRIGIARTLMHDPQVMLLDEPANGLDPQARVEMRHLLRKLAAGGKTLMVSSHILSELAQVCDEVGIIHQGVLKASGPLADVLGNIQRDRLMEIKAQRSDVAAARECLGADSRCGKIDSSDGDEGVIRFRFSGDDSSLSGLLAQLVEAKVRPVTFREIPLSLEEAYLAISGIVPGADNDADAPDAALSGAPNGGGTGGGN